MIGKPNVAKPEVQTNRLEIDMFTLPCHPLFEDDVLVPAKSKLVIRLVEFPGQEYPRVFTRLATTATIERKPVFACLTAEVTQGVSSERWFLGHVLHPFDNWEIAARLIGDGDEMWSWSAREWEGSDNPFAPEKDRNLVQMLRADRPYVARPALGDFPKFTPADLSDYLLIQHLVGLKHMIPCHLSMLFIGHEDAIRRAMMKKLEERLAGFIATQNKKISETIGKA